MMKLSQFIEMLKACAQEGKIVVAISRGGNDYGKSKNQHRQKPIPQGIC